jgi:alpha-ketoglutarate-dependent taurine dioxygenase
MTVETFDAQNLQPLGAPAHPSTHARALETAFAPVVRQRLPGLGVSANRLRLGTISALHFKHCFVPDPQLQDTPDAFVAAHDPRSFNALYAALGLIGAMNLRAFAYRSENAGELFQHLTKHPGNDEDAQKSRSALRGHTDAVFHSLHAEQRRLSASPDYVVLIGLRNPAQTATRLYALSQVFKPPHLEHADIYELKRSVFAVEPQPSFTFPPGTVQHDVPVLIDDPDRGWQIRYSNRRVAADEDVHPAAHAALEKLRALLDNPGPLLHPVVVEPGDVVFINNRIALHGRNPPDASPPGGHSRWLIRTYAVHADTHPLDIGARDTELLP